MIRLSQCLEKLSRAQIRAKTPSAHALESHVIDRLSRMERRKFSALTKAGISKEDAARQAGHAVLDHYLGITAEDLSKLEKAKKAAIPVKPASEETAPETQSDISDAPVSRVAPAQIVTRPDLMQFKRMDDTSTGVNEQEKLGGKWDERKAGNLLLWQPADPKKYGLSGAQKYIVANGHHRAEFGARNGVRGFHAQILREADGYSAGDARRLAAEVNIADGKGSIHDQAKFIRNTAATHGADEALAAARRIGARGRKAANIALSASDPLYDSFVNERLTPEAAETIALAAPGDAALQTVGIKAAANGATPEHAADMMRLAKDRAAQRKAEKAQGDLFGFDDSAIQEMEAQAKVASAERRSLRERITSIEGAAKKPEVARKEGLPVNDPASLTKRVAELKARLEQIREHPELAKPPENAPSQEEPLALEQQTPAQVDAEREKAKRADDLKRKQEAPLKGGMKAGDAVPDMFDNTAGETPLFAQPEKAKAPSLVLWGKKPSMGDKWIKLTDNVSDAEMKRREKEGWSVLRQPVGTHPDDIAKPPSLTLSTSDHPSDLSGGRPWELLDFTPRPDSELSHDDRQRLDSLQRGLAIDPRTSQLGLVPRAEDARPMAGAGAADRAQSARGAAALASLEAFAKAAGKRVLFISDQGDHPLPFNAAIMAEHPDTIFINKNGERHLMALLGHEWAHTVKLTDPDLHAAFQAEVMRQLGDKWEAMKTAGLKADYPLEDLPEEVASNVAGDVFMQPEFWQKLREHDRPLWQRMVDAVGQWLKQMVAKVTRSEFGTTEAVKDIEATRQAVVDLMNGSTKRSAGGSPVQEEAPPHGIAFSKDEDRQKIITPAQDAAYLDAVKRGYTDSARAMVEQAAKAAGYTQKLYHGTNETRQTPASTSEINQSAKSNLQALAKRVGLKDWSGVTSLYQRLADNGQMGVTQEDASNAKRWQSELGGDVVSPSKTELGFHAFEPPTGELELGVHLGSESAANQFGHAFPFYAKLGESTRLEDLGTWNYQSVIRELRKKGVKISEAEYDKVFHAPDNNAALRKLLLSKGVTSIVYRNEVEGERGGDSFIALDPSQIKSADPITRDDQGNVIPLSERFNPKKSDIRFSADATPPESPEDLIDMTHAGIDAAREKWGMDKAGGQPHMDLDVAFGAAKHELDLHPDKPHAIAEQILDEGHRATPQEKALIGQAVVQLGNQIDAHPGDPQNAALIDKLDKLYKAYRVDSSAWGQEGRVIQQAINRDYSRAGLIRRFKALNPGEPTEAQLAKITQLAQDFAGATEQEKQDAFAYSKNVVHELVDRLEKEKQARESESASWLDEALDSLDERSRSNVDAVLEEVAFQHELAKRASASGLKFSAEGEEQRAAPNASTIARSERARDRIKALGTLTQESIAKAKAESNARLAKLSKAFVDPAQAEAVKKAVGGDKTALKLLESLSKAPTPARPKATDAVKKRFAEEARHPGDKDKFIKDLVAAGVSKDNAEKLHGEALKRRAQMLKDRATRAKVRDAVGGSADEEDAPPMSAAEIQQALRDGEAKTIAEVPIQLLHEAMRSLVGQGLRGEAEVIPALTKLVNDSGITASEEQVRERAVDYGHTKLPSQEELDKALREVRAEALKVASIKRVEHGTAPLKSGQQRDKPHQKLRELDKELKDKMKAAGIQPRTSEQQLASVEDATLSRLRNDIEDLQAQIDAGARKVRDRNPVVHTQKFVEEQARLKARKATLQSALDSIAPDPGVTPEEKEKRLIRAAQRTAEHWQERLKNAEWEDRNKPGPPSEKVLAARKIAADAKEAFEQARDLARPDLKKDPEALALARYSRHLDRRAAEYQRRLREKDYSKVERKKTVLDEPAQLKKLAVERLQREFNRYARAEAEKSKPTGDKIFDFIPKFKRFAVLSSPVVFAKLAAASLTRGFTTALEEIASGAWSKLLPEAFTSKAKLEGGMLSGGGWAKAINDAWKQAWKDAADTAKKGESDLDVLNSTHPPHELDFWSLPGRLHASFKAPIKRLMYEHAFQRLTEAYVRDGLDPADLNPKTGNPLILAKITQAAYKAANRSIFLQDNAAVDAWRMLIRSLENSKSPSGKPAARVLNTLLPIVRVPTNILMESAQNVAGIPIGLARLAKAWHTGFDKLTPDEADSIMRTLKKGSLGAALVLLGFYANGAGGYYTADDKRKPGDPKPNSFRIFGTDVPSWLTHAPAFEAVQFGATMRRAIKNSKGGDHGLPSAALAASIGLALETPFLDEMLRAKDLATESGRSQYFGELAKAQVEPQLLIKSAEWTDRNRALKPEDLLTGEGAQHRKANTFGEHLESGIPGLRQRLSYALNGPFSPRQNDVPEILHQYAQAGHPLPSIPVRGALEKKVGHALPNSVWNAYADIRGRAVEREMLNNISYLNSATDDKARKQKVMEIARQASYEAKHALGLAN